MDNQELLTHIADMFHENNAAFIEHMGEKIDGLRDESKASMKALRDEMKTNMESLRQKMKADAITTRKHIDSHLELMQQHIKDENDLTRKAIDEKGNEMMAWMEGTICKKIDALLMVMYPSKNDR